MPEEIEVESHTHTTIHFGCTLNPVFLGTWDEMSDEACEQWQSDNLGPVPCEGTGDTGHWCFRCKYVSELDIISD